MNPETTLRFIIAANRVSLFSAILLGALLVYDAVRVLRGRSAARVAGVARLVLAAGFLTVLVLRSFSIGFIAIFGQSNSLVLFAAFILGIVGLLELRGPLGRETLSGPISLGSTLLALVLVGIASSPLVRTSVGPVVPALRSVWLPLHIVLAFLGEALFAVAFVGSIVWLVRDRRLRRRGEPVVDSAGAPSSASQRTLDLLVYRSIAVGYGLFTVGALVFGAVWAQQSWGRYWGWDPKETWALVTWIVYSLYLHARIRKWGRGRVSHWLSVTGYAAAMFTLFGVNLLYRSLHSY